MLTFVCSDDIIVLQGKEREDKRNAERIFYGT